jgi:hypothetical protein
MAKTFDALIVAVNDRIRVDVDIVGSTNPGQGLAVTLQFTKS